MPAVSEWTDPLGVPVSILTQGAQGHRDEILFALRAALQLMLKRRQYDVVFASMTGLHLLVALLAGRLLGKRIFVKIHGSTVIPSLAASIVGRLELRWMARWAERVMVLNEEMVQEALAQNIPSNRICFMPNPVDVAEFQPAREEEQPRLRDGLGLPVGKTILLYVGRLSPEKGVDWLIRAFAQASPKCPQAMLALLGDGPMRVQLEQLARELGLSHQQVRFLGRVAAGDVPRYLQAADAFALVSPNEGFSCALAEAMASGLPAVVSAIPANVQLVRDDLEGFTAPPGDVEQTAGAIVKLLNDTPARVRMGKSARALIETNYSTAKVVDQYEALFLRG